MPDGMMVDYLRNPDSPDIWLTGEVGGKPVEMICYAPERLTEGTWNLYLLAVHPNQRGKGRGRVIMR